MYFPPSLPFLQFPSCYSEAHLKMVVYMVVGGWSLPQEQCTPPSCDCECLLGYHHLHGLAPTICDLSVHLLPSERSIRICIHHAAPTIPTVPKQKNRSKQRRMHRLQAVVQRPAPSAWSPRPATCAAATTSPCRARGIPSTWDRRDLGPRPEETRARPEGDSCSAAACMSADARCAAPAPPSPMCRLASGIVFCSRDGDETTED